VSALIVSICPDALIPLDVGVRCDGCGWLKPLRRCFVVARGDVARAFCPGCYTLEVK
jgi:hypothetical protein